MKTLYPFLLRTNRLDQLLYIDKTGSVVGGELKYGEKGVNMRLLIRDLKYRGLFKEVIRL